VTTATPTQRITELESVAFRTDRGLGQLTDEVGLLRGEVGQVRSDVELVRGTVNELSVEFRSHAHDLSEVKTRVEEIYQEHGQMLREHGKALREQGQMLREVLSALGSSPPRADAAVSD
jgi:chromosome segregation ATPase